MRPSQFYCSRSQQGERGAHEIPTRSGRNRSYPCYTDDRRCLVHRSRYAGALPDFSSPPARPRMPRCCAEPLICRRILPSPRLAARSKARMSGIREDEIVYSRPASDRRSITMVVERRVPYRFARLLGLSQSLVTVKAMAATRSSRSAAGLLPIAIDANFAPWVTSVSNCWNRSLGNNPSNEAKRDGRVSGAFSPSTV